MQPIRRPEGPGPASLAALGSAAFASLADRQVPPDESFFHRYLQVRASREQRGLRPRSSKRKKGGDDDEEGSDLPDSDEDIGASTRLPASSLSASNRPVEKAIEGERPQAEKSERGRDGGREGGRQRGGERERVGGRRGGGGTERMGEVGGGRGGRREGV